MWNQADQPEIKDFKMIEYNFLFNSRVGGKWN